MNVVFFRMFDEWLKMIVYMNEFLYLNNDKINEKSNQTYHRIADKRDS